MNAKKLHTKMMLSMIFMYFIAPQIWGLWMVLKLKIISFSEYLHMATSPITILLLVLFFSINKKYYTRTSKKFLANNMEDAPNKLLKVPSFHLLSIVLFGSVATFLAMLSLYFPGLGFLVTEPIDFNTVIVGMLAGASLTFIFFFLFTSIIIRSFETIADYQKVDPPNNLFNRYLPFNLALIISGIFLMVISTVKAVSINGVE